MFAPRPTTAPSSAPKQGATPSPFETTRPIEQSSGRAVAKSKDEVAPLRRMRARSHERERKPEGRQRTARHPLSPRDLRRASDRNVRRKARHDARPESKSERPRRSSLFGSLGACVRRQLIRTCGRRRCGRWGCGRRLCFARGCDCGRERSIRIDGERRGERERRRHLGALLTADFACGRIAVASTNDQAADEPRAVSLNRDDERSIGFWGFRQPSARGTPENVRGERIGARAIRRRSVLDVNRFDLSARGSAQHEPERENRCRSPPALPSKPATHRGLF